jgi:hypothetical protein
MNRAGRARRSAAAFRRRHGGWLAAALLALYGAPCPVQAQGTVTAMPVQGLRWGVLAGGIPSPVSPADAARRASIELVGSGQVTVTFVLPAGLTAASGSLLPLVFGATDGRIAFPRASRLIEFDPNLPVSFHIPPGLGGAQLFLGGTAAPGARQPPGDYSGTIVVHVQVASTAT